MKAHSEHVDRLVDALLREELGQQRAPDLAGRILARAAVGKRRVSRPALASLAAATVVVIVLGWLILPKGYPNPKARGSFDVLGGAGVGRGSTIRTGTESATLTLGGYCRIQVQPSSLVRIEGDRRSEQVMLLKGELLCDVDRAIGTFVARTEVGSVRVTGTRFIVGLREEKGEKAMVSKKMFVRVLAGTVLASGMWGGLTLQAGEERILSAAAPLAVAQTEPQGGKVTGILTAKGETWIMVKAEGAKEARKYLPRWIGGNPDQGGGYDKEMLATIKKTPVANLVELEWTQDENLRVISLKMIVPTEKTGTVTGTIAWKGDAAVDVKPDGAGSTERYTARWIGDAPNAGGGFDKDILRFIAESKVGDKVKVTWTYDERKRATQVELLAAAPKPPAESKKSETAR